MEVPPSESPSQSPSERPIEILIPTHAPTIETGTGEPSMEPSHHPTKYCAGFSSAELNALQSLYTSTGGGYWTWNTNYEEYGIPWDFSVQNPNPCADGWQGVDCGSFCSVEILELPNYGLIGTLPADLSNLAI